jgi:AbrB family looped-hinge helix DNA binding protein
VEVVAMTEYVRVGKRGTVVIPAETRRHFGFSEGEMLVMEERADGLLLKPVRAYEVEVYTPERRAEFLLNNAVTAGEYDEALDEVRSMGLDPDAIPHQHRPGS